MVLNYQGICLHALLHTYAEASHHCSEWQNIPESLHWIAVLVIGKAIRFDLQTSTATEHWIKSNVCFYLVFIQHHLLHHPTILVSFWESGVATFLLQKILLMFCYRTTTFCPSLKNFYSQHICTCKEHDDSVLQSLYSVHSTVCSVFLHCPSAKCSQATRDTRKLN